MRCQFTNIHGMGMRWTDLSRYFNVGDSVSIS
jgi:hypothetical protein